MILISLFKNVIIIVVLSHYVACGWYWCGTLDGFGTSWVDTYLGGESDSGLVERYTYSLHWSLTQFTPSTNNICPHTYVERAFALFVVMIALTSFSSFLSAQTSAINQLRMWNQPQLKEESRIRQFLGRYEFSVQLKELIWEYTKEHFSSNRAKPVLEGDICVFGKMPEEVRMVLHQELFYPALERNFALCGVIDCDLDLITEICHCACSELMCGFGQDVFTEGAVAKFAYYCDGGSLTYDSKQFIEYESEPVPPAPHRT